MSEEVYHDVTPEELGKKLYSCADAIRDAVDETRYKNYILPLVFYKSIDDTFADRLQKQKEQFAGDEELARKAITGMSVPDDYRWESVTEQSENIAPYLDETFDALERENDRLRGVVRVTYSDEEALGDQRLRDLIQRINRFELSTEKVEKDFLGEAYMYMVGEFAKDEGKEGGQFFTPPDVVDLMIRVLAKTGSEDGFEKGASFHDPTCGSAGFLVHAASYYRNEQGGDPSTWNVTGQELNADIAAIAQVNTFMHGLEAEIRREDSLSNPQFPNYLADDEGFDYVLANFPFSADWAKDDLKDDKWNRFDWADKLPRADRGDYAFIMHIAKLLNDQGKAAVVVPHGVLFRKHESKYREPMIKEDLVEAIIELPGNLFQNVSLPSAVLVLNRNKEEERKGEVQFIHAADERFYVERSNHNDLTDEGRERVVTAFENWSTEERMCRTVSIEEITENNYNLNLSLYVDTTEPEEEIDATRELKLLRDSQKKRDKIEARMTQHMEALNYE
ncbi:type I restriction-modification system subunit M [Natronolimnohabitans innermongolicus]|uniref:site-specific DNA-methyltransferase (adenine-specific) n=1 Tax=Natronolimnohabitans innermongolicus JCM 12255 TaxID=1227499 RepID=L9X9E6_9EURY|nr:class I SAM-dependent DNA methyltransferase [Natronolimnohabitans innermongolicus]ELY58345.1 N-6 DNA methylase [Natronolimnohabitans innermongolicus JCM 12255]